MRISFIGDIMLGRFVAERYAEKPYSLVSEEVREKTAEADFCIANLESPITTSDTEDSLKFAANAELLEQFKWVDCFSLSNNHINDFGTKGMEETMKALEVAGITHNGLFTDEYKPFLIQHGRERVAVITCADMMNYEFSQDCPYKTLRVNNAQEIQECISHYKAQGYFVILFAHVGMLFTRFPNPIIRDFVHQMVDEGADCVVTAHPHCLGGAERYKEKLIVYSLGDFLMDGASYRRRKAGILHLNIEKGDIQEWSVTPVITNDQLTVCMPDKDTAQEILLGFKQVSETLEQHSTDYLSFYKKQYKKEMLAHSWSTIAFEFHRRGLKGLFQILSKRIGAVKGMIKRTFTDRSKMNYDADAVGEHNISINDIR